MHTLRGETEHHVERGVVLQSYAKNVRRLIERQKGNNGKSGVQPASVSSSLFPSQHAQNEGFPGLKPQEPTYLMYV